MFFLLKSFEASTISQNVMGLINIVSAAWICKKGLFLRSKKFTESIVMQSVTQPSCPKSASLHKLFFFFLTRTQSLFQNEVFSLGIANGKPLSKIKMNVSIDRSLYEFTGLGNQGEVQNCRRCAHAAWCLTLRVKKGFLICARSTSCLILALALVLWQHTQNAEDTRKSGPWFSQEVEQS